VCLAHTARGAPSPRTMIAASVTDSDVPRRNRANNLRLRGSQAKVTLCLPRLTLRADVRQTHLHVREHMPAVPCTSGRLYLNYKVTQCQWQTSLSDRYAGAAEQGGHWQLETKRKSSEGDTLFAADSSSGSLEVRQTHLHVREHMPAVPSLPCTYGGLDLN
jgi:hypothetical protein